MAHYPSSPGISLTFDCADPVVQAPFWLIALGYELSPPPAGWASWESWLTDQAVPRDEWNDGATIRDPRASGPAISFLRVPEPKRAKNRLHLDLLVSGGRQVEHAERNLKIEGKVLELLAAGAMVQSREVIEGRLDHVVMLDPEGNEFCVV